MNKRISRARMLGVLVVISSLYMDENTSPLSPANVL